MEYHQRGSESRDAWISYFLASVRFDNPKLIQQYAHGALASAIPPRSAPAHVIPVYVAPLDTGIMVSMQFVPARKWRVSDAFGRFDFEGCISPQDGFDHLMVLMERYFAESLRKPTPLRWRQAFDIALGCPVHIETLDGNSLQLPLALAVVRALGKHPETGDLPLGNGPVFSSGEVTECGQIGRVEHLAKKAEGFLREYGKGHPAVLPKANESDFAQVTKDGFSNVRFVNCVGELLNIDRKLKSLISAPPKRAELDVLLNVLKRKHLTRDLVSHGALIDWLAQMKAGLPEPYQYRIVIEKAYSLARRGWAIEPLALLSRARNILSSTSGCSSKGNCSQCIGIEDKLHLGSLWVSAACNGGDCREVEAYLASLEPLLCHASAASLSEYWGNRSRAAHFNGDFSQAVQCARQAVACADRGAVAYSGQNRNFLCRMLLLRAEHMVGCNQKRTLEEATKLLKASRGRHMPLAAPKEHALFCSRLELHCARMEGISVDPPAPLQRTEKLTLPKLYCSLEYVRNAYNLIDNRRTVSRMLTENSATLPSRRLTRDHLTRDVLLRLIAGAYGSVLLENWNLLGDTLEIGLQFCELMRRNNLPGWHTRLANLLLAAKKSRSEACLEAVCQATPFL